MRKLVVLLSISALVCAIPTALAGTQSGLFVGGLDEETTPTHESRAALDSVKSELEDKLNVSFKKLEPLAVRTQVVSGMNYFIKARGKTDDGEEKIMHVRIYHGLKGGYELTAVKENVNEKTALKYFN